MFVVYKETHSPVFSLIFSPIFSLIFSFDIVCRCFWYYFDAHTLKNIFDSMSISAGGHFEGIFGPIFYTPLFLENGAIFDHEIVFIVLWWSLDQKMFPSARGHFGVFLSPCWHMFLYFLRTIQYFLMKFCRTTLMVTALTKKIISKFSDHVLLFCQAILAYVPLFLENPSIFSYENVYICSWSYSDGQCTFLTSCPSLLGAFLGISGPSFSCSSVSSELCNILSWNCGQMCLVVLWWSLHQKKCLVSPLLTAILGVFWDPCEQCFSVFWEPFNIFSWTFAGITLMVTTLTKK